MLDLLTGTPKWTCGAGTWVSRSELYRALSHHWTFGSHQSTDDVQSHEKGLAYLRKAMKKAQRWALGHSSPFEGKSERGGISECNIEGMSDTGKNSAQCGIPESKWGKCFRERVAELRQKLRKAEWGARLIFDTAGAGHLQSMVAKSLLLRCRNKSPRGVAIVADRMGGKESEWNRTGAIQALLWRTGHGGGGRVKGTDEDLFVLKENDSQEKEDKINAEEKRAQDNIHGHNTVNIWCD